MLKTITTATALTLALSLAGCSASEPTAEPTGDPSDAATPSQPVTFQVSGMT